MAFPRPWPPLLSLLTCAGAGFEAARSVFHPHSLAVPAPIGRGGVAALPPGQLHSPTTGTRAGAVGLPFGPGAIHLWGIICYTLAEVRVPHSQPKYTEGWHWYSLHSPIPLEWNPLGITRENKWSVRTRPTQHFNLLISKRQLFSGINETAQKRGILGCGVRQPSSTVSSALTTWMVLSKWGNLLKFQVLHLQKWGPWYSGVWSDGRFKWCNMYENS